jgi:magnesium-transporting ATPase (P-type)
MNISTNGGEKAMKQNVKPDRQGQELLITYMGLRQAVGILALSFPPLLAIGNYSVWHVDTLYSSISAYHWSGMRDVFTGILTTIAALIASYRGHDRIDRRTSWIAAMTLMGVVLVPCDVSNETTALGIVHQVCAAVFFCALIYFAAFLFRKTDPAKLKSKEKCKRNNIYLGCALVMFTMVSLIFIYALLRRFKMAAWLEPFSPMFWCESFAVMAFGACWLVKGGFIFKDLANQGVQSHKL